MMNMTTKGENMSDLFDTIVEIVNTANTPIQWDTSAEAKRSIKPHLPKMKAKVLKSLFQDGDGTDDELEQRLGMSHQSLSACRRGCVKDGLVDPTGRTRPTRSGRSANIWTINEKGIFELCRSAK